MPQKRRLALGIALGALAAIAVAGPVKAQSVAYKQKSNNDRVIAFQQEGGLRPDNGEVTVGFYASSSFKITSPRGVEMLIDPWRNDPSGVWGLWFAMEMPVTRTDIGLVTHSHFDHDGIDRLDATMILDRMAGTYQLGDVKITGIAEKHMCVPQGKYSYRAAIKNAINEDPCEPNETTQWNNAMFLIETGGLRLLHWGDNRQKMPDYIWKMIGDIDVAFLPVSDEGHILSHDWADKVMEKINAKVAIPMHYHVNGVNIPGWAGSEPAIQWATRHDHTLLDGPTMVFTKENLKNLHHHVMYFGDHVAFPLPGPSAADPQVPPVPEPVEAWKALVKK
jgi:L-ascorbate metabolism protein UlaG (beta-lactamase superfamily)